jgi:predicted RNA methylase
VGMALPGWQAAPSGGVRFFCKADTRAALLGLRLASNLHPGEGSREGALREHLACGLLVLAGATARSPVLDPFAGSGTILRAAWERFGVQTCLGYEVDGEALRLARRAVGAPRTRLVHDSFEACRPERLPPGTRLVSNLPFGARYPEVPLPRLGPFLERCLERVAGMALLMSRGQGQRVAQALDLGRKNVLVLGQPACIVYAPASPV